MDFQDFFLYGELYRFRDINDFVSYKLPNLSLPQTHSEIAYDLFILMGSVFICIHFRSSQPPASF